MTRGSSSILVRIVDHANQAASTAATNPTASRSRKFPNRSSAMGIHTTLIVLARPLAATKSECRNPKSETNPKSKCRKLETDFISDFWSLEFGALNLFRILTFGFRIFRQLSKFAQERRTLNVCSAKAQRQRVVKRAGFGLLVSSNSASKFDILAHPAQSRKDQTGD